MNISEKVAAYVKHNSYGYVFTHQDVAKRVGGHESRVSQVLKKLEQSHTVVHVAPGLWQRPKKTRFGVVLASPEQIAAGAARKRDAFVVPAGAKALNEIGGSTQLPMKSVFISNKRIQPITVGKRTVQFQYSRSFEALSESLKGLPKSEKTKAAKVWVALDYAGEREATRVPEVFAKSFNSLSEEAQVKLKSFLQKRMKWAIPLLMGDFVE